VSSSLVKLWEAGAIRAQMREIAAGECVCLLGRNVHNSAVCDFYDGKQLRLTQP
jgi:hypothetical protein